MEKKNNPTPTYVERMAQQELEIESLKSEIKQLHQAQAAHHKAADAQKAIEETHKQSQVRFRTIFEQSHLGNKILAPDLRIIEVNEALTKMLGYKKEELLNKKIIEFAHPDFIDSWHELQTALWKKKMPSFSTDTCLVKKNKHSIWCRVTSILFEDAQLTLGYTIVEDITDRKYLEEKAQRLHKNQEMMMYMVAHDLKTPLHIISTLSGFIREEIETGENDKALLDLSKLQQTCNRSYSIIDDLLLIGELEIEGNEKQVNDVSAIIRTVIEQGSTVAAEKEIQVIQEFSQPVVLAKVNKEKITRALENLLSNAIKFSSRGEQIKIVLEKHASHLLLKFIDRGIGIPISLQPTVFNKFTKAQRKGTQGEETTGLGLFITKQIIDKHHGKIWFESQKGEGTTFFIRLPLSD